MKNAISNDGKFSYTKKILNNYLYWVDTGDIGAEQIDDNKKNYISFSNESSNITISSVGSEIGIELFDTYIKIQIFSGEENTIRYTVINEDEIFYSIKIIGSPKTLNFHKNKNDNYIIITGSGQKGRNRRTRVILYRSKL